MSSRSAPSKSLVLAAMIFAVAMTFIDQTIVAIAAPQVQKELGLSSTGLQWAVNAYLLTLAALFPLGGRLSDILGHRRMVVLGIVVFAVASGLCGLTPKGSAAEAWIVTARALQGAGGAIMYPAALAIVVSTFSLGERGRALALFFGVAGGLTAVGPVLGGYLTQWTWRAIFWVNIPVALIALLLIAISRPDTEYRPARLDYRGLVLVTAGIGLSVFGLQQANIWGWKSPATACAVAAGVALLVAFWFVELRTESPLVSVRIFGNRPFLVENLVLFVSMLVFVPVFFFASEYAQISLGDSASKAGIFLLYFFIGFVIAAQVGGSLFDKGGAKRPVVQGCALSAVGFFLWANHVTDLKFSTQQWYIILAGAGMGMMLGPASTDAVNRVSRQSYGEATGITQTVRNFAASLGLAVLGTIQVHHWESRTVTSLTAQGLPHDQATKTAAQIVQGSHASGSGSAASIPPFIQLDFAYATRTVLYVMAALMVAAAVIALVGLRDGRQTDADERDDGDEPWVDQPRVDALNRGAPEG